MIQRTILLKFTDSTTQEELQAVVNRFKELKNKISGIVDIQGGLNIAEKSKEYQVILMIRYENQQAVDVYTVHEEHKAVGAFIRESGRLLDIIVVGIEI